MKEKIKRISSSTWALILALMMVVSSFSVLAATTNVNKTGSGYSAGDTIYFSAGQTNWYDANASTVAYFYGNGDAYYAVFQSTGNDKKYLKATVPAGTFTEMTLIRYNPSGSTFNPNGGEGWPGNNGIWNKIEGITRSDSSYNLYTVTSDKLNDGEWSKYSASDPIASSVSDDIISVLNGNKIMYYVGNDWNQANEYVYTEDKQQVASTNNGGAVTTPKGTYYITHADNWFSLKFTPQAGYKYITKNNGTDIVEQTSSTGSATTISDKNVVSTDFDAGNSGTGTGYTLVYYMKDSSDNYSKVGTSADEVNTKVASLSYGTYTLYTCSTDGTITVLRDTDAINIASPVATSVSISPDATEKSVGDSVNLTANVVGLVNGANNVKYTFQEVNEDGTTVVSTKEATTNTTTFTNLTSGTHYYKVTVSADGYSSVTSDPITITVNKKAIASSVSLSADNSEIESGNTVTLTADVKKPALTSGLTYTFTDTTTNTTQKETTNTSTFTLTTTGKHKFTVTVSAGDKYTTVEDTTTVNVFAPAKEMYLYGDFDNTEAHKWNADFKDYKFEYVNGKYVLKDVPFTGSCGGKERDYAFFRIYVSNDEQYSSNAGADQKLENGVPAKIRKYNDKALKFKVPTSKRVNIEFDLEKPQITVTEVVVQCEMNAKYQISDDIGSSFQDAKADTNIATVNDGLTATGSTGSVKAVNSFEANGNTYVFSKWVSQSGTFANANSKQTTFTPKSDGDVIAQYKRQYNVTCTTPTNGKLTASATGPLAGDSYTITVKPDDGYEFTSLMVYLGTPETSGNDITSEVTNGTYTTTAVNNARYVATFTKKKVDYSKYKLIGHFDSKNIWEYTDGLTFNENGECTFTLEGTSSGGKGGNGQFRFSDGTNDYGATTNTDLQMNTEYTPTKGQNYIYYLFTAGAGTYKVTITKIASDGTPSFKVTKDSTKSKYKLMSSTSQTTTGSSIGDFKTTDDEKVMSMTLSLAEGTYNFYVSDGPKNYCARMNGTLGQAYGLYRMDNDEVGCVKYNLSAGLYTVTYTIVDEKYGTLKIDSVAKPLADSVTLSAAQTSVTAGRSTTITATLNNSAVPDGKTYTYKYYDSNRNELATKTSKSTSDSIEVTSSVVGTVTYYVTVSTNATYKDPNYDDSTLSYADVSSEGTSVSYVAKSYYIAEVNDTTIGDRYALTQDFFKPKSNPVTLSFFNAESEISEDTVEVMTVDESKNKYCQIITSNIEDSAVPTGIPTYKIICNEGAKDPVVYVKNGHIYAVASLVTGATSKTFDSDEKVTYYFAEPTWATDKSVPSGSNKDGLRIKYWNNSVPTQNGFIDVTTPVASDGTVTENGTKNTIYVKNTDFVGGSGWSGWNDKVQTYFVYKVDLPVWATSFQFVTSGESTMTTNNGVVADTSVASMGLNPNRIYMFFDYGENQAKTTYARGVVLDSSFWTKKTKSTNNVETKNFKTNAVDYATGYNYAEINNNFNKNLNELYDSSYSNPLFFGYFKPDTTQVAGNKNFRIQDNLAMRCDNKNAYYASVQGLAGSKLSTTQNNKNGYAYLQTSDNAKVMPLFDYASLEKNPGVASQVFEKLKFPFNESNYNGVTTYSYDSYTDKNREVSKDKSKNDFEVTSYKTATVGSDNGVGFFPFEQFTDKNKANTHKYGFGTEFDIDFYMSETGRLETTDGDGKDITFNFSGDDDVWVYVDGVLVLDLGGAHKASSGLINFSTMEVIYKAAVDSSDNINSRSANPKTSDGYAVDGDYVTTVDLAKLFAANGVEFNNTSSSKKHTLQMFYMERGSVDSNCSISFNLPQNTGLLVRNDVNFDSVNAGLKDITMGIANKDYFSYTIGNKIATDSDITKLNKEFGESNVPAPATTFADADSSFAKSKPQYPVKTTNNVIRRVINGKTYYLAVKYTGDGSPSSYYWNSLNSSSYLPLNDINYSLPDDFAMIEKDSTANGNNGTTAVSGRVKDGVFNLLFNESASFDSKTPSNTLLQVVQKDNLYNVNAGSETEAMSCGAKQTDRTVKDYYTTSYTITDDKSQKNIGSRTRQVNNGDIIADDKSEVENAFYFADYSADKSDSSAMTVNFTNYVTTDKIKISKDLTDPSKINSDHFTFVVKLSNIFGDSSYADKQEYEGLTYDVYDKKNNALKTTRTYGKSGVSITANEYAIITGVPVGTSYEVYEKTRSGYNFNKVTAAFESDNRDNSTDFEPTISSSTVTGTLPTITASGSSTEPTLHLTYTNEKVAFTISFKYYDREVKTGQVAHIATTPTVKNVSFADISEYKKGSDAEGYYYDFAQMITDAKDKINVDNVIDSYIAFPRQSVAENYIKNQLSYRDFDDTTSTYKKYSVAYPKGNFSAHTDYYGRLQGSKDAKVSDGEDWVTYYNGNKKYATEETALQHTLEVTSISVWYFNTLKTYSPTFHFATAKEDLSQIGSTSKYVAKKKINTIKPVFYNVRLGIKNDDAKIDSQGTYLEQYGVNGFTDSYSGTSMSIKDNNEELKFLYWSYDAAGKSIASNSYKYGYRVTNNIHLYAIYGDKKDNTAPGLTVSMNSPDYYIDNNGINRVRLNTMMNVYNCPDSDQKIRQVSVIYLQDPNNYISKYIGDNNTEALKAVREKVKGLIKEQCKKESFTGITIKIDGENDNLAKGLTYKVWNDDGSSLLTNKNRVQFTTSFKQELLGGAKYKNLYTFAAMNYKDSDSAEDNWLISDNYIKYTFNEVGKVTNGLTQVNSLQ